MLIPYGWGYIDQTIKSEKNKIKSIKIAQIDILRFMHMVVILLEYYNLCKSQDASTYNVISME